MQSIMFMRCLISFDHTLQAQLQQQLAEYTAADWEGYKVMQLKIQALVSHQHSGLGQDISQCLSAVCLSVCLSVSLSLCLSVCLSACVCLCLRLTANAMIKAAIAK